MKPFKENFKLLFFVLLCSVIPYESTSQSIEKMPDNKWWALSNLNLDIPDSYCYNDSIMNCQKYGRLYTWEAAQNGCNLLGEGWHLPSTAEWNNLLEHFGGAFEESISDGMPLKNFCVQKSQLLGRPWEAIEIPMGLIPELRHMVFIGPLQHLMILMPDS